MEEVEKMLLSINKFKERGHFSLDIYYEDMRGDFVCKVHGLDPDLEIGGRDPRHFRNKKLIDSMIEAYDFCSKNI